MNCKNTLYIFCLLTVLLPFYISCEEKTEYQQRVEKELSKNTRVDSLFLGYHFGMTSEEFFKYSWDMNKKGIITGQTAINYKLEELKSPADMSFYPQFKDNKIFKMPVQVHYLGWAPWNQGLFSDSLMLDLVKLYEDKYNADFFMSTLPENNKEAYIDIQGNRQISIYKYDDRVVNIEFLDLTAVENNL